MSFSQDRIRLVERGNIWKFFHNEKIVWESLAAEALFYRRIGYTQDVPNPATGMYSFSRSEALQAVRDGLGHTLDLDGSCIFVTRFRDDAFGKKVRDRTLENAEQL